jgi:UDP-2,3-diacylglucosamine pyrophosphatase LpxH
MEYSNKRPIDILVLSDIHLGTYGCHAKELLEYLNTVSPNMLILNGDIIDIWQFRKRYWPNDHMKVVKKVIEWITQGVNVYYITGNHDEMLRKFSNNQLGNLHIVNKLVLTLNNNQKAWFFHGDVFDVSMKHSKWLAKLGGIGYDLLIRINRMVNFISESIFKRGKISLSKRIKNSVKSALTFIGNFEQTIAEIAIENQYDYVVCGHIHQPVIKTLVNHKGSTVYMNSGDWIENLTALEYQEGEWRLYMHPTQSNNKSKVPTPASVYEKHDAYNYDIVQSIMHEFVMYK